MLETQRPQGPGVVGYALGGTEQKKGRPGLGGAAFENTTQRGIL